MESDSTDQPSARRWRAVRLAKILIGIGLFAIVLWLIIAGIRVLQAGRSLREQQRHLESLLDAGLMNAKPAELEGIALTVRDDVKEIVGVARPFAALGPYLGWLPVVGPLAADGQHLLDMADAGSVLAVHASAAFSDVLSTHQMSSAQGVNSLPEVLVALDGAEAKLARADMAAGNLFSARRELDHVTDYPPQIIDLITKLDEYTLSIQDGLKLAQIAPELLGLDRARNYLVLAQNEDELRPTGGFISGAGVLSIDRGRVVSITFDNANLIDDWQNKPYGQPPAPFTEFMGMDIFLLRDSNFWPDFPVSAAESMNLYTYARDVELDGVVAIDQRFVQELLGGTGPLPIPELDRIVDASNAVRQMREEWGSGGDSGNWIIDRKAFMAPLANAFQSQLESGRLSDHVLEIMRSLQQAAQERHLQLYVSEPDLANTLNQTSWSGRLLPLEAGDFVHVSDTNMGFNKVNAVTDRSLNYQVDLSEDSNPSATLHIRYSNPPASEDVVCQPGTQYDSGTKYETLMMDCYWNYLRVYVPAGSVLKEASEHPVPSDVLMSGTAWLGSARIAESEETSLTVFDNFIVLSPGEGTDVEFSYELPSSVIQRDGQGNLYRLFLRKQAGTGAQMAEVSVTLPDGARLLSSNPQPSATSGNQLDFDLTLATDRLIEIEYR